MSVKLGLSVRRKKIIDGGRKKNPDLRRGEAGETVTQWWTSEFVPSPNIATKTKKNMPWGGLNWSIKMVIVTEFSSHDNWTVFESRSGSDVLDISQLYSVASFVLKWLRAIICMEFPTTCRGKFHVTFLHINQPRVETCSHVSITSRDLSINMSLSKLKDRRIILTPLLLLSSPLAVPNVSTSFHNVPSAQEYHNV